MRALRIAVLSAALLAMLAVSRDTPWIMLTPISTGLQAGTSGPCGAIDACLKHAIDLTKLGQKEAAARVYLDAVQRDPEATRAQTRDLMQRTNFGLVTFASSYNDVTPHPVSLFFELAEYRVAAGQLAEAAELYSHAIAFDRQMASWQFSRRFFAREETFADMARRSVASVIKAQPDTKITKLLTAWIARSNLNGGRNSFQTSISTRLRELRHELDHELKTLSERSERDNAATIRAILKRANSPLDLATVEELSALETAAENATIRRRKELIVWNGCMEPFRAKMAQGRLAHHPCDYQPHTRIDSASLLKPIEDRHTAASKQTHADRYVAAVNAYSALIESDRTDTEALNERAVLQAGHYYATKDLAALQAAIADYAAVLVLNPTTQDAIDRHAELAMQLDAFK